MPEATKRAPRTVNAEHLGAHHDIDLTGLTAGNFVTLNGHWYGLEKADCTTHAFFHPETPTANGPTSLELKLVHCPWLGCPAVDPADPVEVSALVDAVPRGAFEDLIRVAEYVSCGRSAVGHQPDGAAYPDATARRALGALDAAGLLPIGARK